MDWQVQEAKQRLSELLRASEADGAQYITRHGEAVAVVLSMDDFERLRGGVPTFKELLRQSPFVEDFDLYLERSTDMGRDTDGLFDE